MVILVVTRFPTPIKYTISMILARAPLRISLAGGGSDLPSFYESDFGEVINFTINKYVYIAAHTLFHGGIRLSYSKTEQVNKIEEIVHPLFRNTLQFLNYNNSLEVSSFADVPGNGTGMGSSSAFTSALLKAIGNLCDRNFEPAALAEAVCHIEMDLCKDPIGKQDQYASAIGGINRFVFQKNGAVEIKKNPALISRTNFLDESLLLYYTGMGRKSSDILIKQNLNLNGEKIFHRLTNQLRDLVPAVESAIIAENAFELGGYLTESWKIKEKLAEGIGNSQINDLLDCAMQKGALGGKLLGAGGGGFLLLCVEPSDCQNFQSRFKECNNLPFKYVSKGAEILIHEAEG